MPRDANSISVTVLAVNQLSGKYIVARLSEDCRVLARLLHDVQDLSQQVNDVFVIELSSLVAPIRECIKFLLSHSPEARFVAVDGTQSVREMAHLLKIGIHGFIKDCEVDSVLGEAVVEVARGRLWFSREVLECLAVGQSINDNDPRSFMTPREAEVLSLLERRLTNKEIGSLLNINESTVKYHVSNIFSKLDVASRRELASKRTTRTPIVSLNSKITTASDFGTKKAVSP